MDKIRIFEAFAGYGSQSMAMQKLKEKFGLDYEIVGISEIDKYAIQAYNSVHPGVKNYGDISKIDWNEVPDFDLFTYSFPCTDISSAGQQKGLEKGSGTRSSLLWECQKAIEIKRPKYCLMENVAALVSEKFRPYFLEWERLMCRYGYTNYNKVLNAKDYGIPQNRERIFMVSIHNAERSYYWPEPFKLEKRLKDVLEQNSRVIDPSGISYAVTNGHKDGEPKIIEYEKPVCVGNILPNKSKCGRDMQAGRVYDANAISPCLTVMSGGNTEPKIIEPIGCAMRGRNPENPSERGRSNGKYKQRIEMGSNISNTITSVQKDALVAEPQILTPKRTDFGKQVRKQYESGALDMSRHDMTELEPRTDGVSNTLTSVQKDNLVVEPKPYDENYPHVREFDSKEEADAYIESLRIPQATKQGYIEVPPGSVFDASYPDSKTRRGRVQEGRQVSPTLMASGEAPCRYEGKDANSYRIRKLTPRECFRLMGVSETNIDKIQQSGVSQSQQYKMAGNSIVVDVLEHIFRKLFVETGQESQQLSLF